MEFEMIKAGLLTENQAALLAGVSRQCISNWRKKNKFMWFRKRSSNRVFLDKDSFLLYLESRNNGVSSRSRKIEKWVGKMPDKELQFLQDMLLSGLTNDDDYEEETSRFMELCRKVVGLC